MGYDSAQFNDPGSTWTISTPVAGITVTALMVVSTASAIPIVGVHNLSTTRKRLAIRRAVAMQTTGSAVQFIWGVIANSTIAVTSASAIRHSDFASTGYAAKYFAGATAVVGTPINFRPLGGAPTGAIVPGQANQVDETVDGSILVPPGGFVGIFADQTGGIVRASLTVAELDN